MGGNLQGLRAVLMEEGVYDAEGQPLGASFVASSRHGAAEVPAIVTELVQTPSPNNPLGARRIGEAPAIVRRRSWRACCS